MTSKASRTKLDPRTKLLLVVCLTSFAVAMNDARFLAVVFAVSLVLLLAFRVNPRVIFKKVKMLLYIMVFIAIMQSIFAPSGAVLIGTENVRILTAGGLAAALEFILRILIIITSAGILTTASSREIIQGLTQIKLPYEIAFMTSMSIRFLPVLSEEFKNAFTAIQLRGVDFKKLPLKDKLNILACLFQPVIAGAIIKAKKLSMSVEMRGFRKYDTRTSRILLKLCTADYTVMALSLCALIGGFVAYFAI